MKGRRRQYPTSSLEEEFNTFKIGTVEDVDMKSPLAVLDVAKDLIEHKSSADVEYALLSPLCVERGGRSCRVARGRKRYFAPSRGCWGM